MHSERQSKSRDHKRDEDGKADLSAEPGQQSLVVRYGYPASFGVETSEGHSWEGSISQAEFEALLDPLKHIRVPPYPGEEVLVCDGAIYGFELVLGSTRFSYQWHTIAPAGWEPLKDWLHDAVYQLRELTGTPYGY